MPNDQQHHETTTIGILAAVSAPLFMALGFIIWDVTWTKHGGSAFALNLFKCNLASIGFVIAGVLFGFTTTTTTAAAADSDSGVGSSGAITGTSSNNSTDSSSDSVGVAIGYLILSGWVGIVVGDMAWLEALRQLGASRVLVIDTVKPFMAALLGKVVLGESLKSVAFSGIALTVVGICVVGLEREKQQQEGEQNGSVMVMITSSHDGNDELQQQHDNTNEETDGDLFHEEENDDGDGTSTAGRRLENERILLTEMGEIEKMHPLPSLQQELGSLTSPLEEQNDVQLEQEQSRCRWGKGTGYPLAILNVVLDTYGSLLTKQHGGIFSTWSINLIRFGSAGITMVAVSCFMRLYNRKVKKRNEATSSQPLWYLLPTMDMKSWFKICLGVLFVTFICPALSNYALFQIALALALTLGSVTPIYALLLEWPIHGAAKRPTFRSLIGASLAVGGVVILSIFSS